MAITLEVNGNRYTNFTSINVYKSIETISGSFNFVATSDEVISFPIKAGQSCKVLIDNTAIITGFIENISVNYDSKTHSLQISGRDKTCDIIDSSVIGKKEFQGAISLQQIITTSLARNGITGISVLNEAGAIAVFEKSELFGAGVGESLFAFLEKYARKRQVLLSSDGDGNIVLKRAGTTRAIAILQNLVGGDQDNNILSASISYDFTQRYNKYIIQSQLNNAALYEEDGTSTDNAVSQTGEAPDNKIRASRQLEITSNSSDNTITLKDLASWHANLRRIRGTNYTVVVQDVYQDEAKTRIWATNELVEVVDDFADVSATLLVSSVEYNFNLDSGTTTTLTLVDKDAYTLEANISAAEQRVNDKGLDLTE